MTEEKAQQTKWINPLSGVVSPDMFRGDSETADLRATGSTPGLEFIAPAADGALRGSSFMQLMTLYKPSTDPNSTLEDEITHFVGLPVVPYGHEEGSPKVTVTGFKGYWLKEGSTSTKGKAMLTQVDPKAGFGPMLDKLWDTFRSLFFTDKGYDPENGPTQAKLEAFMDMAVASIAGVKGMARQGTSLKSIDVVETTFIVGPSGATFPARLSTDVVSSPIIFKVAPESRHLINPEYFANTQPRLSFTAMWEVCKYFGLGPLTPLILKSMFDVYGVAGTQNDLGAFLEGTLTRVNSSGKYVKGVKQGNEATGLTKANRDSVLAIVFQLFETLILFSTFQVVRETLSAHEICFDVSLEWYNEYADDYGTVIVGSEAKQMHYAGVPTQNASGSEIKAWPFACVKKIEGKADERSQKAADTYKGTVSLQPLRLGAIDATYELFPTSQHFPMEGWVKDEGGSFVSRPHISATFDPEVGLVAPGDEVAFLDLTIEGEVFAGWIRKAAYDSPQMYRLAMTRATNHRYSLGLGPMTLLDPFISRNAPFKGNLVPLVIPKPTVVKGCANGQFVIDPNLLLAKNDDTKKVDQGQEGQ